MTRNRKPVLVVHDSFVCAVEHSHALLAAMKKAYREVLTNQTSAIHSAVAEIKSTGIALRDWQAYLRAKERLSLRDYDELLEMTGFRRNPKSIENFECFMSLESQAR
jgi:hypothetical protein